MKDIDICKSGECNTKTMLVHVGLTITILDFILPKQSIDISWEENVGKADTLISPIAAPFCPKLICL